jgi:prepilin-type N-terminal cleavage/methylation domain-containing protein
MKMKLAPKRGFTIIELVVTLAIFTIISAITLANFPGVGSRMNLELLANDVALLIRQAQVYGLGIKNVSGIYPTYGVHVSSASSLIFYYNKNGPAYYDPTNSGMIENYTFGSGETVEEICIGPQNAGPNTTDDVCKDFTAGKKPSLDVAFTRPRPDAHLCIRDTVNDTSCIGTTAGQTNAKIVIDSARGHRRMIVVWNNGQIEVKCLNSGVETCPSS